VFAYAALMPWVFFSNAVIRCSSTIVRSATFVKATALPREVFPAAEVARSLIDFLISGLCAAALLIWFRVTPTLAYLWLPALIALVAFVAMVAGLAVAALGTYSTDVIFALPIGMQFWLLITPVMYRLDAVPARWRTLYRLNPLVGIVEGFRSVLATGAAPDPALLGISIAVTSIAAIVIWPAFRQTSRYFADAL